MCVSITVAGVWFGWLLPGARRSDPLWAEQFTRKAYWNELQRQIRHHGWTQDDYVTVGRYGDKGWAEWIMAKAEAGQEIANCGHIGHKDEALKYITCNNPSPGTNWNTEQAWLTWWHTNKNKSQLDWIRDGLRAYGVLVHLPPNEFDHQPLLALLGNSSTNVSEKTPHFVKYNAFRWLRDSGFDVLAFAMSNVTAETPALVRAGVLKYGELARVYPKEGGVGLLGLGSPPPDLTGSSRSAFFRPAIQVTGYSLMLVPLLIGAVMLAFSCRGSQRVDQALYPMAATRSRLEMGKPPDDRHS